MSKLIRSEECVIVMIDMQTKLLPVIFESELLLRNIYVILELAICLEIPVVVTQQYTQGLGETVEELQDLITKLKAKQLVRFVEKTKFSAYDSALNDLARIGRKQIVLMGIESHICVLQSALDFSDPFSVYIVEDATSSTQLYHKTLAIQRMQQQGVQIVDTQMLGFELLGDAKHKFFKEFAKKI